MYRFFSSFPYYIQHDQMDCGATCLKIIAKFYNKSLSLKYLRDLCFVTREGVSLFDIAKAAEAIGFRTLAIKINFEDLKDKMPLPIIIHWKQKHFVVIYKITKSKVYISDPLSGLITYSHKTFRFAWEINNDLGYVLVLETTPEFYSLENLEQKYSFNYFLRYLKPYHQYLIQVLIGMFAGILISVFTPFISQSIVDFGIGSSDLDFVNTMLLAGITLAISSMLASFIQSRLILYVSERINMSMISDFICKMLKLPISFFERKMTSDILIRIVDHERIQAFIMSTLIGVFINVLLIITYSIIMLYYEKNMLLIFSAGTCLYICWILIFLERRKYLDKLFFDAKSKNQNDLLELLDNITEIKATNIANNRRWRWELSRYKIYNLNVQSLNLNQIEEAGATFILQIQGIFLTYVAAKNVINGTMTLGMMMAAQYILGQLNTPIKSMVNYIQTLQLAKVSLQRINEVTVEEKQEIDNGHLLVPENKTLTLHRLDFTYNPHLKNILNNINITIPQGEVTAIVGESGSGKSTLLKLLLRFYTPTTGEIRIGNIPLESIDLSKWRNSCATVLQDGKIFNDTILYNITLKEDENDIDSDQLQRAITLSNIEEFINDRPLKLYTPLGTQGSGISQGQKQRILIARAIYRNPDFIFLDEATNSLDANNEQLISKNLSHILEGKTAVIIAHRLSTIKKAHNIIVLHKGHIVEQGSHLDLIKKKGIYYNLILNQLDITNP